MYNGRSAILHFSPGPGKESEQRHGVSGYTVVWPRREMVQDDVTGWGDSGALTRIIR